MAVHGRSRPRGVPCCRTTHQRCNCRYTPCTGPRRWSPPRNICFRRSTGQRRNRCCMRPPITGPSASAGTQTSVQGRTWCCTRCTFLDRWCLCPCRGPDRWTHHRDAGRRQRSRATVTENCRAQTCGGPSPGTQVVFNLLTSAANGCTQPLPTERGLEVVVRGSVREQVRWWGREVGQQVGQRGGLRWGAVVHAVLRRTPLVPVPEHWLSLFH